ncbi:eukaryotic translation initiation factor 5 [Cimex lectularius]|uniref:Eukaryotic translation initiation factor 5 n=1 Tax=Cimex lectularius TaxID=79782 RepID=A0A8I6R9I9_CIMLE|nr:eukaryotic translation initiation factor 5 [Cimex lectularius]XP_014239813.1 eukaryotic translation initiation factor 5 [Cimex lectularius]XP_014239814.1 eukaryotic translation initiation factor 5 [Cimex lectularius]XP_014239815.1 eukaryotic translation initiation factor 5 [Cimex lectularius]XP_014239816.1 eukaryotic translation initiation factor 5 [Cimex lectularius]XP_024082713.1 eukaryotic translation initiation factor 5 [Cimex lectularius]
MGTVNVNRNVSDTFYRYKMPRLLAKVEGKGNGIKTVIVNMADVAKSLGRPATYPTKYFGCELGAQTLVDFKNDRFIVNGSHDATKLQDLLDGFIRKFVLCPECDNPETDLVVNSRKETISQECKACGFHGLLQFNHKLNTYIIKNPPSMNPGTQGASLTEGKRAKRSKTKQNGEVTTNGDRSGSPKSEDEPELIVPPPKKIEDEEEEEEWAVDVSEEAVRARLQDLTEGAKNLTMTEDLEKTEKERMDMFYGVVKLRKDSGDLSSTSAAKELLQEATRLEIKSKAPLVLAELLFDDKIHIQIKTYRVLLLHFTHEDPKAQKYLIGGIEQIIAMHKAALLPKVPAIFNLLYNSDILEEGVLLEWGSKVRSKYVPKELSQEIHNKAEPFLTWLKEAEEEEESSEEEDDLEIEYDDRAKASPLKEHKPINTPKPAPVEDDGEDDVDIDAI